MLVIILEVPKLSSHFLYVDIVVVLSSILRIVSHTWLEYLLTQFLDSFAGDPSSHGSLHPYNHDYLLESVVLPIKSLSIGWVSSCQLIKFVVVSSATARVSHNQYFQVKLS